jgi:hypothetical protein
VHGYDVLIGVDRHPVDDVFDLFQCWNFLFPLSRSDTGVLFRQIKILGIGMLKTRLVARLPCKPLEEAFELVSVAYKVALLNFSPDS